MTRAYRTRLEVLHDFLEAVRRFPRKSRIIGYSNLNPNSFDAYVRFCLEHHLIEPTGEGYRATALADQVIEAIYRVISKSSELDAAVRALSHVIPPSALTLGPVRPSESMGPRLVDDWDEMLLRSVPRLAVARSGAWARGGEPAEGGAVLGRSDGDSDRGFALRFDRTRSSFDEVAGLRARERSGRGAAADRGSR